MLDFKNFYLGAISSFMGLLGHEASKLLLL